MKNKNFLFDLIASQPIEGHEFHGGGKYAKKLFFALAEHINQDNNNWKIYAIYDSSLILDNQIRSVIEKNNIQLLDICGYSLDEIVTNHSICRLYTPLPFNLNRHNFFSLLSLKKCEIYCTIHGLRTLEIKTPMEASSYITSIIGKLKFFTKKIFESNLIKRDFARYGKLIDQTNVMTVSNHTKYSIMTFFPNSIENKIRVFYSPDVTEFGEHSNELEDSIGESYFLLTNGNRWLKNNLRCIKALDQLFSEHPEINKKVVITGVANPDFYLNKIKNKNHFIFYKYVSDTLLTKLYQNAYALIYMSLNEGFGYPPLEAMKWGTPVLTSPFTSIPEVCSDCVLYSDPYSIPEIKNRILQLMNYDFYCDLTVKSTQRYNFIKAKQEDDLILSVQHLLA